MTLPPDARFEWLGELARGGMGVVYRARDRTNGEEVALKLLHGTSRAQLLRFAREAALLQRLDHPGIVRLRAIALEADPPFLAFDLIAQARDLEQAFEGADLDARLDLLQQVAEALGHAHAEGVVHRDVKPANVLVDADDRVKVADFGVAAAIDVERLTRTGAMVGTPQFMSPEQVAGDRALLGPPVDVWALGVLLYLALTDELPFQGASLVELAARILEGPARRPRDVRADVPRALESTCLRALRVDPAERHADGAAFAAALLEARRGGGRSMPAWIAAGFVTLAVLAAGAIGWSRAAPEPVARPSLELAPSAEPAPDTPEVAEPPSESLQDALARAGRLEDAGQLLAAETVYQRLAEAGQPEAMDPLGTLLAESGRRQEALTWWRRGVELGYTPSLTNVAASLLNGWEGVARRREGFELMREAALAGDPRAMNDYAIHLEEGQFVEPNLAEAVQMFERSARAGFTEGMINYGNALARGDGLFPQDLAGGREWLQRAAHTGHPDALNHLGVSYKNWPEAWRDDVKAERYLRQAAEAGHLDAAVTLGILHFDGRAGPGSGHASGLPWVRQAAEGGNVPAMYNLAVILLTGRGDAEMDREEGWSWTVRAAERGHVGSMFNAGYLSNTDGPVVDPEAARTWYELAAAQGHAPATVNLGRMLELGQGGAVDAPRALELFERALALGEPKAGLQLGGLLERGGEGVEVDLPRAAAIYRSAAQGGEHRAAFNLGLLYAKGHGVEQDDATARFWLSEAARGGVPGAQAALDGLSE